MHQFTDEDIRKASKGTSGVTVSLEDEVSCIILSKEDLLYLLKLIEETN